MLLLGLVRSPRIVDQAREVYQAIIEWRGIGLRPAIGRGWPAAETPEHFG